MWVEDIGYIVKQYSKSHTLKDRVVIDAQNFFYNCYKYSELRVELGAECDRYADYLRNYLSMFKEANIECYFIFKGGTKNLKAKIIEDQKNQNAPQRYKSKPIFGTDVHLQVLREMKFDYVFTEYEAKSDCITLAKKYSCPVISKSIELAFSGVNYIPSKTLDFDKNGKILNCKMFSLDNLLTEFNINNEDLAMFILLTNRTYFDKGTFTNFFDHYRIPIEPGFKQNKSLLFYLSKTKTSEETVLQNILSNTEKSKELIDEYLVEARKLIAPEVTGTFVINYISTKEVPKNWFEAGVALNIIAKPYIDLYRSRTQLVSGIVVVEVDEGAGHPIQLSLNIIKYAYDLLTNFQNNGFELLINHWDSNSKPILIKNSIKKPTYQAVQCVFEKGWNDIRSLGLFEHFMEEEINFEFDKLEMVPADAKLLLISLVYFHHKKMENINKIAYGMILSYVMLGVVDETVKNAVEDNFVTASDCKSALELLDEYFKVEDAEIRTRDVKLLHSLLEFQHCLNEINYLNKLCGSPFEPTIYAKTFNGTFVYKIVVSMQNEDESPFINKILGTAPTVLKLVNDIIELYKKILV